MVVKEIKQEIDKLVNDILYTSQVENYGNEEEIITIQINDYYKKLSKIDNKIDRRICLLFSSELLVQFNEYFLINNIDRYAMFNVETEVYNEKRKVKHIINLVQTDKYIVNKK